MENNQVVAQQVEEKKYVIKCPRCSSQLYVKDNRSVAYMCPVCNNLFRMYVGTKKVKDVSRVTVSETYTAITKDASEK